MVPFTCQDPALPVSSLGQEHPRDLTALGTGGTLRGDEIWGSSTLSLICHSVSVSSEKAMAPHSSTLAWKIPWTEEPDRGCHGVAKSRARLPFQFSLSTFMHWKRKWQPTSVFLPGESQGRGSLVGFRLWGHRELDTTEAT